MYSSAFTKTLTIILSIFNVNLRSNRVTKMDLEPLSWPLSPLSGLSLASSSLNSFNEISPREVTYFKVLAASIQCE